MSSITAFVCVTYRFYKAEKTKKSTIPAVIVQLSYSRHARGGSELPVDRVSYVALSPCEFCASRSVVDQQCDVALSLPIVRVSRRLPAFR